MSLFETKILTKPILQKALTDLRNAGFKVVKVDYGYQVKDGDKSIMTAMTGTNDYLCRIRKGTFEYG
tara:strand:+ start:8251 stop:8451 length:201 start_codon:yes stop_codon:yes gene_type:complete